MTKAQTKTIPTLELQVGNIVHFYGARFEVLSTRIVNCKDGDKVMTTKAKWLDGAQIGGYFGDGTNDWNFQGNHLARTIEI